MNEPERVNYNAFRDDESDSLPEGNTGLKISGNKSRYAKDPDEQKSTTEDFENAVAGMKNNEMEVKNRIADASTKYRALIRDRTVSENKSPLKASLEKEVVKELSDLGLQLNNDQSRPEGIGSIGLCNLLMQINFQQRDRINNLAYEVVKLKRIIEKLAQESSETKSDE